jgi:hypothetical protein
MGNLKPGGSYIYERVGNTVFRRESGQVEREVVGYDHRTSDGRPLHDHLMDSKMWGEIRREARTNYTLQKALEQCIIIYHLSKDKDGT